MHLNPFTLTKSASKAGRQLLHTLNQGTYACLKLPLSARRKVKKHPIKKTKTGRVIAWKGSTYIIVGKNTSGFELCDGLIKVQSKSMSPAIKKGQWIGISRLRFQHLIIYGNEYLVVTKDLDVHLGMIFSSPNNGITVRFQNPKFREIFVRHRDLKAILSVQLILSFRKAQCHFC